MEKIKICVLDGNVDSTLLYELTGVSPKLLNTETTYRPEDPLSHGTLCAVILIETLKRLNILDNTDLYYYSIGCTTSSSADLELIEGIRFCQKNSFDLVSCSVGIFNRKLAKPMFPLISKTYNKPLIIAATANNNHITYPAALASVIGVRCSENKFSSLRIYPYSWDGVDLSSPCWDTPILNKNGLGYSNSFLAPQICALVANYVINGVQLKKEEILKKLSRDSCFNYPVKPVITNAVDIQNLPPIVYLSLDSDSFEASMTSAKKLQKRFEKEGYCCGILSDAFRLSDFENGYYRIDSSNIEEDVYYYIQAAENDLFLLLIKGRNKLSVPVDLTITYDLCDLHDQYVESAFNTILNAFDSNKVEQC